MKKFIGVLLTVVLCMCLTVPVAFASAEDAITDSLTGLLDGILSGESSLDESLDLGSFDLGGIIEGFVQEEKDSEETDMQVKLEQGFQDAMDTVSSKLNGTATGIDLSWLTTLFSDSLDADAVNEAFSGLGTEEMSGLLTTIADAFSGVGIDMTTFDVSALGQFDITTLLGGAEEATATGTATDVAPNDSSMLTTDLVTGLLDSLKGGLTTVGIDADALLGSMADNEIINFFANMYIGFVGPVAEESTTTEGTSTPDTGDSSAVAVALATLCVAAVAAGTCLKKKED